MLDILRDSSFGESACLSLAFSPSSQLQRQWEKYQQSRDLMPHSRSHRMRILRLCGTEANWKPADQTPKNV